MFRWLTIGAIGLAIAASPAVAESSGEDSVTHNFSYYDQVLKMGGERSAIVRHLNGISTNAKGSGMFHNMLVRCVGLIDMIEGKAASNGRCTETDQDGDQIFSTYENKGGVGSHTFVGGTGKYKGISGQQVIQSFTNIKGADGVSGLVIPLKTEWSIP